MSQDADALKQARKMEAIGFLAAGITHEINTPIQFVRDNIRFFEMVFGTVCEVLRKVDLIADSSNPGTAQADMARIREILGDSQLAEQLADVPSAISESLEGAHQIAEIVKGLQDYTHPGEIGVIDADLNGIIESCVLICRHEWKFYAQMKLDLCPALPHVRCLAGHVGQIIINLVVNAVDAIRESGLRVDSGLIEVSTRRVGDNAELVVQDNGCGIPDEIRDRIFEFGVTTKPVGVGTGVGLGVVKSILQEHHGQLSVESTVGAGTKFVIRLPLSKEGDVDVIVGAA